MATNAICAPQQSDAGAIELVERGDVGRPEQSERIVECACPKLRLSRDQRALRTAYAARRQRRSAFEEGGGSREAATRLRPPRGALELAGHLFVGHGRRLRTVPGAAIRVELGIGCVRQRAVSLAPLVRLRRPVHRRAHERMTEHHCTVQRQQAFRLRGVRGRLRDPKLLRRAPQKRRVADRFCCRQEQQPPRVAREPHQPPREALLDPGGQRQRCRQPETSGELGGRQPARELQERERIPACLGDDPLEHGLVQPRREDGLQQRPCIPAAQRLDAELREAGQSTTHVTRRERERDPLRQQAVSHERERSGRCAVEPLRVVDHAQERLLLDGFGEEAENREPDKIRARRLSGAEPEGDAERVPLRIRETLD